MDKRVWYLGITRLIRTTGRVSSFIFLPLIFVFIYHISFILTGIILGFSTFLMSLVQYFSGAMTDKIGRRFFLIFIPIPAGFLYIFMFLTVYYNLSYLILIALFEITIIVNALQYPAIQAAIADITSESQRLSGYTIVRVLANAGAAIGPIAGAVLAVYNFGYIFLLAGIATFIEIIILYFNVKETYIPIKEKIYAKKLSYLFNDRFFLIFSIIGIILMFLLRQRGASLTLFAFDIEKLPILYLAYIYAVNGLLVVVFQYPIYNILNKMSPVIGRSIGVVFYFIGYIILAFGHNLEFFLISMSVMTIGEDFVAPTTQTIVTLIAPSNLRGTYIGIYNLITSFGSLSGSIIGLYVLSYFYSNASLFWIIFGVGTLITGLSYIGINSMFYYSKKKSNLIKIASR